MPKMKSSTESIVSNINQKLIRILANLLNMSIEELDENTDIREFGLDSVALNELAEQINDEFEIDIDAALLFEYSTIKEIENYLLRIKVQERSKAVNMNTENVPASEIEKKLLELLAGLLSIPADEIDTETDLRDLGLDSVALNDFTEMINSNLGTSIDATLLFEKNTIRDIGLFLCKERSEEFITDDSIHEVVESLSNMSIGLEELFPSRPNAHFLDNVSSSELITEDGTSDIAIVGISGRMPQSDDLNEFWAHLIENEDLITEIPQDRWDLNTINYEEKKLNIKYGGFLKNIRQFDAEFFKISPREAELMDPQQRILLEEVWHLFEDAGYKVSDLSGRRTGVFIGAGNDDYNELIAKSNIEIDSYAATGNYQSVLSNRISYFFNFTGPSMTIDTACSSSLVAIHQAVMSLKHNECEMAIAGGVNVICDSRPYLSFSHAGMLSKDGRCKTFDEEANGYVRGEGVGVILLMTIEKARKEGRHIYGIIKGTAVNHNGKTNSLTVPNPNLQAEVIVQALKMGKINPNTISFVEAHGTGTSLGDPIEINGLKKAFKDLANSEKMVLKKNYCGIGSVKTNIGHLEFASGMAGVFKVLLAMKHKIIPGIINYHKTNEMIHLEESPFYIVDSNKEWTKLKNEDGEILPRRAGVSSFGFGGTNAHIIIEEFEDEDPQNIQETNVNVVLLSAKNEERLKDYVKNMVNYLQTNRIADNELLKMAFTLQTGREVMEERAAFLTESIDDLVVKMESFLNDRECTGIFKGNIAKYKEIISILQGSEDIDEVIEQWINQSKYDKVLNLWVKGLNIKWHSLYDNPHLILNNLPVYPFGKSEYWIPSNSELDISRRDVRTSDTSKYIYKTRWESKVFDEEEFDVLNNHEKVLCFYGEDSEEIANQFIDYTQNQNLVKVKLEKRWKKISSGEFVVDCMAENTFEPLINCIENISTIYYFGGIIIKDFELENISLFEKMQCVSVNCLFKLMKSLGTNGYEFRKLVFRIITNNTFKVLENDKIMPYSAAVYGLAKVADKEFPNWKIYGIDIDLINRSFEKTFNMDFSLILRGSEPISRSEMAVRNGCYYIRKISPAKINQDSNSQLKVNGTYIIIGGVGGIGFQLALYLSQKVQANIVLIGRRKFNMEIKAKLDELIVKGGKATYIQADITDYTSIQKAINETLKTFEHINGIFHSALVLQDRLIINMDENDFRSVIAPKAIGCINLHNAIKDEKLDFIMYFSSAESFIGSAGQSNYAAGCCFTDAFALYESECGFPSKVINWGYWGEVGVAANEEYKLRFDAQGIYPIKSTEGIKAIEDILNMEETQYLAMKISDSVYANIGGVHTKVRHMIKREGKVEDKVVLYKDSEIKQESIEEKVESIILSTVAETLKTDIKELDLDVPYNEYGVDSIMAGQIVYGINNSLGLELGSTVLFNYPTTLRLKEYILNEFIDIIKCNNKQCEEKSADISVKNVVVNNYNEKNHHKFEKNLDIAVIGMSGRFPGAKNINEFWKNLVEAKDSVNTISRWKELDYFDSNTEKPNKSYINVSGMLDDIDTFDPLFFNISPREAEVMDPKQRLFLEEAWKALEDAGLSDRQLYECKCGVFVGSSESDYMKLIEQNDVEKSNYVLTGNLLPILSARISYLLNMRGPSLVVSTACSSSLVAVHQACLSILAGDSDIALAGGVNVFSTPTWHVLGSSMGMFSPTGKCKPFDDSADGFIPAEGVGAIVLKKLDKAIQDGDNIYGVIAASGLNEDGKSNGITAPNGLAQTELEIDVYNRYNINPEDISYIEAHGTGTKLGDPIEIEALSKAYSHYTDRKQFCPIGSVKANIGHALEAAGMASIIKVLLCMKYKKLVPSINYNKKNKLIAFEDSPVYVNNEYKDWVTNENKPRIAAISSFGISGTNAHLVIKEYKENEIKDNSKRPQLITFSAKTEEGVHKKVVDMLSWLIDNADHASLSSIAYTLLIGRSHFPFRIAYVVDSIEQLIYEMKLTVNGNMSSRIIKGEFVKKIMFANEEVAKEAEQAIASENITQEKMRYIATLYTKGYELPWENLFNDIPHKKISLPTYPFSAEKYWIEKNRMEYNGERNSVNIPFNLVNIPSDNGLMFNAYFDKKSQFVCDHIVDGEMVLPAAVYIEMVRTALEISSKKINTIKNIVWEMPIIIEDNKTIELMFKDTEDGISFEIYTYNANVKYAHAQGTASYEDENTKIDIAKMLDINEIISRCSNVKEGRECYEKFETMGLSYGPDFRTIQKLFSNEEEALAYLKLPCIKDDDLHFIFHPSIMDGIFQMVIDLIGEESISSRTTYVPFFINKISLFSSLNEDCYAYAIRKPRSKNSSILSFSIRVTDLQGKSIALIDDYNIRVYQKRTKGLENILLMLENNEITLDVAEKLMEAIDE